MTADQEFKDFSKLLAEESGAIIRKYFRTAYHIDAKQDTSPVTIADRKAEEKLRELIMKHYPDHGIIGEEFGIHKPNAEFQWILDPIDGTKSFIAGAQTFGTLIGLCYQSEPILGVIHQPILREFYIGDNSTASLNDMPIRIRECNRLQDALLMVTDHLHFQRYQPDAQFEKLIRSVKLYRMWGDCYGYAMVASGFADIMIDPIMNIWDTVALLPIVRGAGGVITGLDGGDPVSAGSTIATNKALLPQVLDLLYPEG